ncbi:hypothetical protein AV530_010688 [Patagioenas fasciata monilis]|uniref:Uncharacterized protein n=1 Tax=Patagioenas fasciata monilis TaxID=372326 RepID=A0A1V4K7K9_PATFA|nr:hypothetical protein AV530_010688 [Patagioenas fasciata monilis]
MYVTVAMMGEQPCVPLDGVVVVNGFRLSLPALFPLVNLAHLSQFQIFTRFYMAIPPWKSPAKAEFLMDTQLTFVDYMGTILCYAARLLAQRLPSTHQIEIHHNRMATLKSAKQYDRGADPNLAGFPLYGTHSTGEQGAPLLLLLLHVGPADGNRVPREARGTQNNP